MNYTELIAALEAKYETVEEFAYAGSEELVTEEIGEMKEIDSYGGEGQGESWWKVYFFPKHDIHIKINGYYASYSGTSFDGFEDCKQVKPKEKTITVYE